MASAKDPSKKPGKKKDEVAGADPGRTPVSSVPLESTPTVISTQESLAIATPPLESTMPPETSELDDSTPRTLEQMAPNVALFRAEDGGRPQDEIAVPFALARETQDGKGEREPRPSDDIEPTTGEPREG